MTSGKCWASFQYYNRKYVAFQLEVNIGCNSDTEGFLNFFTVCQIINGKTAETADVLLFRLNCDDARFSCHYSCVK